MPKRRIPEEPRPPKTSDELRAERIERKLNRLGGEILMIDRELDERSGQTTLF